MSLQSLASIDEFYGIETCVQRTETDTQKRPLLCEKKSFAKEVNCQVNIRNLSRKTLKLASSEVTKAGYEESCSLDELHTPNASRSELESSYYEELDYDTSAGSDTPADAKMSQISLNNDGNIEFSHNDEDFDSDCVQSPIEPPKERTLKEPAKNKPEFINRKLQTIVPKKSFVKPRQTKGKVTTTTTVPPADYLMQNVLAARKIKTNDLRNEIADLQRQYKDLEQENKILRRINNKQQRELTKIQESRGVLPELVKAHTEEIRVMKSLLKQSRDKYRELEQRMKSKDSELERKKQELQKLKYLTKDNELLERNELHRKNESLETIVKGKHQAIMDLNRKLELLEKCYKRDIAAEKARQKEILNEMKVLQLEYDKLQCSLTLKEKKIEQQNIYCNYHRSSLNPSNLADVESYNSLVKEDKTPNQTKTIILPGDESSQLKKKYVDDQNVFGNNSQTKVVENFPIPRREQKTDKLVSRHSTVLEKSSRDAILKGFITPARKYPDFEAEFEKLSHSEPSRRPRTSPSNNLCKTAHSSYIEDSRSEKKIDSEANERLNPRIRVIDFKESDSFSPKRQQSSVGNSNNKVQVAKQILGEKEMFQMNTYIPSVRGDHTRQALERNVYDPEWLIDSKKSHESNFISDSSFLGKGSNKSQEMRIEKKTKRNHERVLSKHDPWF